MWPDTASIVLCLMQLPKDERLGRHPTVLVIERNCERRPVFFVPQCLIVRLPTNEDIDKLILSTYVVRMRYDEGALMVWKCVKYQTVTGNACVIDTVTSVLHVELVES